jgi:hypothetical protein
MAFTNSEKTKKLIWYFLTIFENFIVKSLLKPESATG